MKEKEVACLALGLVTGAILAADVCLGCLVDLRYFILFYPIAIFGGMGLIFWVVEALRK